MTAGIVGIVLAAGASQRFGEADKLLAPLEDGPAMAIQSARRVAAAVDDVIVVIRPGAAGVESAVTAAGLTCVVCDDAAEGMGRSIAAGVRASAGAAGWLIALADMPWIRTDSSARVAEALRQGAEVARPRCAGQPGHPVGFAAQYRPALLALRGDQGARAALEQAPVTYLDVDDEGVVADVDTPAALRRRPAPRE